MSESNPLHFSWKRRIEFCETDAAGIAHFSTFLLLMEQSEHALFRSLGLSVFSSAAYHSSAVASATVGFDLQAVTWPRVRCEVEYLAPARFEEELIDEVCIERMGAKSVTFVHRLARGSQLIAKGTMVSVCSVKDPATGNLVGQVIPDPIRLALAKYAVQDGPRS
jgi:acyl-CoA thioester hydrolase